MADQRSAGKASSPSGRQALRAARDYVLPLFLLMALVALPNTVKIHQR